jgi:hypothetical protein
MFFIGFVMEISPFACLLALLACLILISVSSRKVLATLSLRRPPLTRTHVNWCPCRNDVAKSYSLWCLWRCHPNRSVLVVAVFYHRPQRDLKSLHKNVTGVVTNQAWCRIWWRQNSRQEEEGRHHDPASHYHDTYREVHFVLVVGESVSLIRMISSLLATRSNTNTHETSNCVHNYIRSCMIY